MTPEEAFFTLFGSLSREGPGLPEDVAWAVGEAGVPDGARILDAGAGSGGDIAALLAAVPGSQVTAVEAHAPFVERIRAAQDAERVTAQVGDMGKIEGTYDFIWSAGAVYNIGVREALMAWKPHFAPGGCVAFSHACWFTDTPSEGAVAFWQGYDGVLTKAGMAAVVGGAGYRTLAARPVSDAAWEAYYMPMEARIATLRPGAGPELTAVLDDAEAEIRGWRAHRRELGYLLSVVAPE